MTYYEYTCKPAPTDSRHTPHAHPTSTTLIHSFFTPIQGYDTEIHHSYLRTPLNEAMRGSNNSHVTDEHIPSTNQILEIIYKQLHVFLPIVTIKPSMSTLWAHNTPEQGYRWTNIGRTLVTWWTNNGRTIVTWQNTFLYEPRHGQYVLLQSLIACTTHFRPHYYYISRPTLCPLYPGPSPMQPSKTHTPVDVVALRLMRPFPYTIDLFSYIHVDTLTLSYLTTLV